MESIRLPSEINDIIKRLNENGFEAYAVGGCVRDMLLGRIPSDYDVTTNALPDEIKNVFKDLKTVDTGIKHGTVTVITHGFSVEVTTYRIDGEYKDSRHPESVTFSKELSDDLKRRDFTVNALAFDNFRIIDCHGGLKDIRNNLIRCVGDPRKRFSEDALRILRALRFSSVLGYDIEEGTANAVLDCADLLNSISRERIFAEIKKLICGKNAKAVLLKYRPVFELIFPPLCSLSEEEYTISAQMAHSANGDAIFKIAALLYFSSADSASASLRNLKSDKASSVRVQKILSLSTAYVISSEKDALLCLNRYDDYVFDYLNLRFLYCKLSGDIIESDIVLSQLEFLKKAIKSEKPYKICQLAINGNDLKENGIAHGQDIGKCLNKLLFSVIDGRVENNKKSLLEFLIN